MRQGGRHISDARRAACGTASVAHCYCRSSAPTEAPGTWVQHRRCGGPVREVDGGAASMHLSAIGSGAGKPPQHPRLRMNDVRVAGGGGVHGARGVGERDLHAK